MLPNVRNASLKNEAGVSVTCTKGKLEAFQKHYKHLRRVSTDSDFDSNWKELVERKVSMCGSLSKVCEDEAIDREIKKAEIAKHICLHIVLPFGITLLSVVGKVFCKVLNNRLVEYLDRERALHEGQAGFRKNRSCIDNVYTKLYKAD